MDIKGKTIWVIGASTGIGRALAIELASEGAKLVLSARNTDALQSLNASLGGTHTVAPLDVTDRQKLFTTAQSIQNLDAMIYMAADYTPTSVADIQEDTLKRMLDINLLGAFHAVQSVLPMMRQRKVGLIALCGSVAGYRGLPMGQPYSASKAAIINLAESLRAEEAPNGIDVRLISPGFVHTPMTDKNSFDMPMIIEPEDAAKAIVVGLKGNAFEIHFPKRFTRIMKVLRILPAALYFKLAGKIKR